MTDVQLLKGHSGCRVELRRHSANAVVRKISPDVDYNERLLRQADKQARLGKVVTLPAIFECGTIDGLAYFDMEYVNGRDFRNQCLVEAATWIFPCCEWLMSTMVVLDRLSVDVVIADAVLAKCRSISPHLANRPLSAEAVDRLGPAIAAIEAAPWHRCPATEAHGDLTLENILFRSAATPVLIDVLDGELSSTWLDLGKLLFDIEIGWSLRAYLWDAAPKGQEPRLLAMLSRHLGDEILLRVAKDYPGLVELLPAIKALHALRIVPYTRDPVIAERLARYLIGTMKEAGT